MKAPLPQHEGPFVGVCSLPQGPSPVTQITLCLLGLACAMPALFARGQAAPASPAAVPDAATLWKTIEDPAFDTSKSFAVKDVVLQRDRLRVLLDDGTVQFTAPPIRQSRLP